MDQGQDQDRRRSSFGSPVILELLCQNPVIPESRRHCVAISGIQKNQRAELKRFLDKSATQIFRDEVGLICCKILFNFPRMDLSNIFLPFATLGSYKMLKNMFAERVFDELAFFHFINRFI